VHQTSHRAKRQSIHSWKTVGGRVCQPTKLGFFKGNPSRNSVFRSIICRKLPIVVHKMPQTTTPSTGRAKRGASRNMTVSTNNSSRNPSNTTANGPHKATLHANHVAHPSPLRLEHQQDLDVSIDELWLEFAKVLMARCGTRYPFQESPRALASLVVSNLTLSDYQHMMDASESLEKWTKFMEANGTLLLALAD